MVSLVIPIPELPEAEVWNVKNAWLFGRTVDHLCPAWDDQQVELPSLAKGLLVLYGSFLQVSLGIGGPNLWRICQPASQH